MEALKKFVEQFGEIPFPYEDVVKKGRKYYLIPKATRDLIKTINEDIVHAGLYLGEYKGQFNTTIHTLNIIAPHTKKKVILEHKSAWLFICQRDVFAHKIDNNDRIKKNSFVIITNEEGEVLGLAKKIKDREGEIYKNIMDIGDFLRREQSKKKKRR